MAKSNFRPISVILALMVGFLSYLLTVEIVENIFPSFSDVTVMTISIFNSFFVTATALVSLKQIMGNN